MFLPPEMFEPSDNQTCIFVRLSRNLDRMEFSGALLEPYGIYRKTLGGERIFVQLLVLVL